MSKASSSLYPPTVAYGAPVPTHDPFPASAEHEVPTVEGQVMFDVPPAVPTFDVSLPRGAGPGTSFNFQVDGRVHAMVVPEGVRPGQVLRCMLVPADFHHLMRCPALALAERSAGFGPPRDTQHRHQPCSLVLARRATR